MTRRTPLLLVLLIASTAHAQDFATSFDSTEVVPGLYMLTGAEGKFGGGNIGLLAGNEHVVLIDDGMVPTAPAILEAVRQQAGRSPDFVINTHVHGDHVGGNALFSEQGSYVVAHDNIYKRLVVDSTDAGGEDGLPVITFADAVTFHVNGTDVRVFHVASAHTDGDGVVHFSDLNVIQAGDIMFHGIFPFIDLDSGGSVDGYVAAQRKLIEMADDETIIVPGHGPLASRADLEADLAVLIDSHDRVKALVDRGLSEDEVLAENPLSVYHDDYNWGFITTERMTSTLYRALTSE